LLRLILILLDSHSGSQRGSSTGSADYQLLTVGAKIVEMGKRPFKSVPGIIGLGGMAIFGRVAIVYAEDQDW